VPLKTSARIKKGKILGEGFYKSCGVTGLDQRGNELGDLHISLAGGGKRRDGVRKVYMGSWKNAVMQK